MEIKAYAGIDFSENADDISGLIQSWAASQEVHLKCPWTVDDDHDDPFFVSTSQKPEFPIPEWNQ